MPKVLSLKEHNERLRYLHQIGRHRRRPAFGCPECIRLRGRPWIGFANEVNRYRDLVKDLVDRAGCLEPTDRARDLYEHAQRVLFELEGR